MKRLAERLLAGAGLPALGRLLRRRYTLVLAYHNIVPDDAEISGDRSLHLRQSEFRAQLDLISRTHEVVPLRHLLGGPRTGRGPRVAITFDDAYRGALRLGVPELVRRDLPATVFVSPGRLGAEAFWWDAIADGDGAGLAPSVRAHALGALAGRSDAVLGWARERGRAAAGDLHPLARPASGSDLPGALRPGDRIALGSHSWSHPNLARISPEELERELRRPLAWLRRRFPDRLIPWIAYPYGICSPEVARAAERAGYEAGVRVAGGWVKRPERRPFTIPRLNVPASISREGFALRAGGWFAR